MTILGIGTDICVVRSFAKIIAKHPNYPRQFCNEQELDALNNSKNLIHDAICIFSIKEAVGKAFGTGLVETLWFDDIHVDLSSKQSPAVSIDEDALRSVIIGVPAGNIRLKLTYHTNPEFVTSFCVLQTLTMHPTVL
ncbi:MAG: 4'-phosphopantetheinyl transferase family protein [Parasphingorhabdus sp.]